MRPGRTSFGAALVVAGFMAATGVAMAHDGLVSSTPADGQSVDSSPPAVELEFTDEPESLGGGTAVVVTAASAGGDVVSTGDAEIDGAFVRQALLPDLPEGEYVVGYRVVSSDGHQVEGATRFFVGPVPASALSPLDPPDAASTGSMPGIVVAVGALALVTIAVLIVRGRSSHPRGSA